jgi:hypothetical protein
MTFTLFHQGEHTAIIVTDTLVTRQSGEPAAFTSKVVPLVHLNMAVCSMGQSGFGRDWENLLKAGVVGVSDIETLNDVTPQALRSLWKITEHQPEENVRICHIGFPAGSDRIIRYQYESANDFEPERFDTPHLWMQPQPQSFKIDWRLAEPSDYVQLVNRIRDEEEGPHRIGGELHATLIGDWSIHTTREHRFPDYAQVQSRMIMSPSVAE